MKTISRALIASLATGLLAAQTTLPQQTANPAPTASQGSGGGGCGSPAYVRIAADPTGLNLPGALSVGNLPTIGNNDFIVCLDDAADICGITPGSETWLLVAEEPFISIMVPGAGCQPGSPGLLMIDPTSPSWHTSGPVTWTGPGTPACHSLVIPNNPALCGVQCVGQGVWLDDVGPSGPFVLTEPLRFGLGV